MTKIFGYPYYEISVEIDGNGDWAEAGNDAGELFNIECSDGTTAKMSYNDKGHFVIEVLKEGTLFHRLFKKDREDSDALILEHGVEWVAINGDKIFKFN